MRLIYILKYVAVVKNLLMYLEEKKELKDRGFQDLFYARSEVWSGFE